MKTIARNKKVWEKPAIDLMNIKRDTFSGSITSGENNSGNGQKDQYQSKSTGSRSGRSGF